MRVVVACHVCVVLLFWWSVEVERDCGLNVPVTSGEILFCLRVVLVRKLRASMGFDVPLLELGRYSQRAWQ